MKKMYIISLIIVVALVGLFIFSKYLILGKELEITFITAQKHTSQDLAYKGCLNDFEWMIISGEEQRKNLEQEGYVIPYIDFSKNFLILSRYKISKLYLKSGRSKCSGVPDGRAVFDKENSNTDFYYIYLMPRIILSQGIG